MPFGWTGVDLFFVLSGYLIGGVLIDNRNSRALFGTFYARRIFRIFPLYLLFLTTASLTYGTGLPAWRFLTFTQNFAWAHSGLTGAGITGLTWSLAVEEQFYLILPILIRASSLRALMVFCVCCIVVAPACRVLLLRTFGVLPYVMLPGRMDTLFTGVIVACIVRHSSMLKMAQHHIRLLVCLCGGAFAGFLILGVATGFSPGSLSMYLFGYSLLSISFGCGLLAVVIRKQQFVRHKLLVATGVCAYSIYLFHQIILSESLSLIGSAPPAANLTALGGTIAVAVTCWYFIERPFIGYARSRWDYI
jgi:peptidoglycan/LPS O-acetylase OafA/YrhL